MSVREELAREIRKQDTRLSLDEAIGIADALLSRFVVIDKKRVVRGWQCL